MFLDRAAMKEAYELFNGADVVHLHVPWDPICMQLGRLCRRIGIPYIITLHGMLDDWTFSHKSVKKRVYLALGGQALLNNAAFVQCTAEIERQQSEKWYPKGRTVVAPLPFDLSPYSSLPGPQLARQKFHQALDNDDAKWLFVGRLHPIKRIELLIQACRILVDQGVACRVLIAGSGEANYEQKLRSLVQEFNLSDRVQFLGFVTGAQKTSLYQAADGAALASSHESFGYSAIEAMACATPIITTKAVNIWQELQSSGGASIVEQEVRAIASAMAQLSADPSRRSEMGGRGRAWVFEMLNPYRIVEQYERMYAAASDM